MRWEWGGSEEIKWYQQSIEHRNFLLHFTDLVRLFSNETLLHIMIRWLIENA